jgi:dipeptidyl aminopeptidase/acylaminoacyl peptidase
MLFIKTTFCLFFLLQLIVQGSSTETKSSITLDEFFEFTTFPSVQLSPNGKYLLIHKRRPAWDSNSYENSLWLYETYGRRKTLITKNLSENVKPQWSPSGNWIVMLVNENASLNITKNHDRSIKTNQYIYFYSIKKNKLFPVQIAIESPFAITWSDNDFSLYFSTLASWSTKKDDDLYEAEWKDVIQHRQRKSNQRTIIGRIDIDITNRMPSAKINIITNISFLISELLFVPLQYKLVFMTAGENFEDLNNYEMYSLDLQNSKSLSRLTKNQGIELDLQLATDGNHVLFRLASFSSSDGNSSDRHLRLFSVDLISKQIQRFGKDLDGSVLGYTTRCKNGIYILEQLRTNIQINFQQSWKKYSILLDGWNGTYETITSALYHSNSIAFVYSSFEHPMEVYFAENINKLYLARPITNENKLFTKRNLPKAKLVTWIHDEDNRTIEGILHYPPEKFEFKNLPLLVLIHGGPYEASLNHFHLSSYYWAVLAASEGWLVFEPNYRGSTGYGNQLYSEIVSQPVSRAGKDILSGVDYLIKNGIADPDSLAVGGYSFGGFITNWLITQTSCFNAALTGAGSIDHVSTWGLTDAPIYISDFFGGFLWEVPEIYVKESPIYYIDNVRTPTHIITGSDDARIPVDQSFIMERALHNLGVPVKLLLFPNEGHLMNNNPWHAKIKVREELKWLHKYGLNSTFAKKN